MRALVLCLAVTSLFGVLAGCDSGTGPIEGAIYGRVVDLDGDPAPLGTTVYALHAFLWFGPHLALADSTATGVGGWFTFPDPEAGAYRLVAGVRGTGGPSSWSRVTPLSDYVDGGTREKDGDDRPVLVLHPVESGGTVSGAAMSITSYDDTPGPAGNALIKLLRLEGPEFAVVDSAHADTAGAYGFVDVPTGNHMLTGLLYVDVGDPLGPYPLHAESAPFFVDAPGLVLPDTLWLTDVHVDKPAIYIYPETPGAFEVSLDLGPGVRITESLPEYGEGWTVDVAADGRMDDAFDYLFYELSMPMPPPPPAGWRLEGGRLDAELAALAERCGLIAAEGAEFTAYWAEHLDRGTDWAALPVWGPALDRWAGLSVTPAPESVWRVWVFFAPLADGVALPEPALPAVERRGTTVIEWGGAVLPVVDTPRAGSEVCMASTGS